MKLRHYRDCDARLRLRKRVIELYNEAGELVDRMRIFDFLPCLRLRVRRRAKGMLRRHKLVEAGLAAAQK